MSEKGNIYFDGREIGKDGLNRLIDLITQVNSDLGINLDPEVMGACVIDAGRIIAVFLDAENMKASTVESGNGSVYGPYRKQATFSFNDGIGESGEIITRRMTIEWTCGGDIVNMEVLGISGNGVTSTDNYWCKQMSVDTEDQMVVVLMDGPVNQAEPEAEVSRRVFSVAACEGFGWQSMVGANLL